MVITAKIDGFTIGSKHLFEDLGLSIDDKEKIAIIGRNGVGKTTLFKILTGAEDQYSGKVEKRRGIFLVATEQEHRHSGNMTTIEHICNRLPQYASLAGIIGTYPATMGADERKISVYTEAVDGFSRLGYYGIGDRIVDRLAVYQITAAQAHGPFSALSGGEKHFADLVRVELSNADLALIDEPTNHMDYVGKAAFVKWLLSVPHAVAVITHDRDVLASVDRVIEIKDRKAFSFPGNYEAYLRQNGIMTVGRISEYETAEYRLVKLKKQILSARAKKVSGYNARYRMLEERLQREYDRLKGSMQKPSFWVDRETVEEMPEKVAESYHRYKARNIRIRSPQEGERVNLLLEVRKLSLGYDRPLFKGLTFSIAGGSVGEIRGRNGAGKTTLIKAIMAQAAGTGRNELVLSGEIIPSQKLKLGYYEQEIGESGMNLTLAEAVTKAHEDKGAAINDEKCRQVMAQYLFNPAVDGKTRVGDLSGGEKARLQIIRMLANNPNLLVLDEPTNHLDLPSIEELEKALAGYHGAVLFVSHDGYFTRTLAAEVVRLGRA